MTSQTARNRSPRLALVAFVAASAVAALFVGEAHAQYRVDNGSARDANNRVGSGGFNTRTGGSIRDGGLAGNYVVTGNVTGGRAFRGSLGYTDSSAFRGSLGSAAFDTFYRDSIGTSAGRASFNSNYATIQPFFGGGQTVAAPAGFVRDPTRGGGYVSAQRQMVTSNDGRIDFGGASRSDVAQGVVSSSRVIGGPGLSNGPAGSGIAPFDISAQMANNSTLSEYTTLARPRSGLLDTPLGTDSLNSATGVNRLRNAELTDPSAPPKTIDGSPLNGQTGTPGALSDPTLNGRLPPGANSADTKDAADSNADPRSTGQGTSLRSLRAMDNNSQYAELRRRLEAADNQRRLPGSDAVDRANDANATILAKRKEADEKAKLAQEAKDREDARTSTNANKPKDGEPVDGQPVDGRRVGDARANAGGQQPAIARDTLNLPRPTDGSTPATQPAGVEADAPMRIKSLATGVKDKPLADALGRAETLMKDGKFGSAIEVYERAERASNDDTMIFMGRSIAELGGSYYRRAETHMRQAFAGDRALLFAKFDLRELLTDARLNFLVTDLGDVARTNEKDPGPLLLLAFIYYNGGMEDRAARALAMAQTRAGGNDQTITLLQQNWKLPAAAVGGEEDPTK